MNTKCNLRQTILIVRCVCAWVCGFFHWFRSCWQHTFLHTAKIEIKIRINYVNMSSSLTKSLKRFLHWGPAVAIGKSCEHFKMEKDKWKWEIIVKIKHREKNCFCCCVYEIYCLYVNQVRLCIVKQTSSKNNTYSFALCVPARSYLRRSNITIRFILIFLDFLFSFFFIGFEKVAWTWETMKKFFLCITPIWDDSVRYHDVFVKTSKSKK